MGDIHAGVEVVLMRGRRPQAVYSARVEAGSPLMDYLKEYQSGFEINAPPNTIRAMVWLPPEFRNRANVVGWRDLREGTEAYVQVYIEADEESHTVKKLRHRVGKLKKALDWRDRRIAELEAQNG